MWFSKPKPRDQEPKLTLRAFSKANPPAPPMVEDVASHNGESLDSAGLTSIAQEVVLAMKGQKTDVDTNSG
ncbi:hypothetical protein [Bradyrhizobium sp.]|uniref:hypothetical protein n=1 Tax=Bradyrhizobium sp. TaxID=376 RepID=UPI00239B6A5E|nr:hypothetical protein [Bradyrhizobium sp.]MDE2379869.1 hypothetical protein [Bradyrhizobium sp.]